MKILITLIVLLNVICLAAPTSAHDGHNHKSPSISQADVVPIAKRVCKYFSMKDGGLGFGQLSESWANIDQENISVKIQSSGFFIASARNATEKKTLYILVSDKGEVYDANFTGAFSEKRRNT